MSPTRPAAAATAAAIACAAMLFGTAPASALPGETGGAGAPEHTPIPTLAAGGSAYSATGHSFRPLMRSLSVPATIPAGSPPRVSLELDEPGASAVDVQVAISDLATRRTVVVAALGWVPTGRPLNVRWPAGATLAPGRYHVGVSAHDRGGASLLRRAHSSGVASLTVTAPLPPPPAAVPPTPAPPPSEPEAGGPTPAQTAAAGAVFPVAGVHSFGGPENRFGAPRGGHTHQGQDVLAAEGTPVLAPLAGSVSWTSYQAEGAGYYAVEHTAIGLDLMFAHCQAGSLAVIAGSPLAAGANVCRIGQTGSATVPHLHFEVWLGGWQAPGGRPIDPLAYLQAWDVVAPTP